MDERRVLIVDEEAEAREAGAARVIGRKPALASLLAAAALARVGLPSAFAPQDRRNRCENCAGKRSPEANYCPRCGHRRQR